MTVNGAIRSLLAICILFAGAGAAQAACTRDYTIRVTENYPPYFRTGEDGQRSGLEVTFARQVMAQAGCEYRLVQLPWRRALLMIESGELDILTVASFTEERAGFGRFSIPYRREIIGMMMRLADLDRPVTRLADLHQLGLQAVFLGGGYHGPEFKAYMTEPEFGKVFRPVTQIYESVPGLMHGRFDAILSDAIAMSEHIRERGLSDRLGVHEFRVYENDVFFLTSRKSVSEGDLDQLNQAITRAMAAPENPFASWHPE